MKIFLFLILMAGAAVADNTTPAELKKAKAEHAKADTKLNAAYKAAMAALEADGKEELKKEQRAWLEYRDSMAQAQVRQSGDEPQKPEASATYWEMMAGLSDDRTEWLGTYTNALPKGFTGEWTDSHGGRAYLQDRKDGVAFGIETVRGRSFNLGGIAGLAKKAGQGAEFVDKATADQEGGPCKLFLTLDDSGNLTIKGERTETYHGKGAYFDGVYRKVSKLKKPVSTDRAPNDPEEAK